MRLSAKADYALRASLELAAAGDGHVKAEALARAQSIPLRFLEQILLDLKHAGLVASQRGAEGGYWLAKSPAEISLADVIRAVEGPLANVRGVRPEELDYEGSATALRDVFVALRANIRAVEGPLANVRGVRPEELEYEGAASALREVFVALRASVRTVLEEVTLADVAAGRLPARVRELVQDPEAWAPH